MSARQTARLLDDSTLYACQLRQGFYVRWSVHSRLPDGRPCRQPILCQGINDALLLTYRSWLNCLPGVADGRQLADMVLNIEKGFRLIPVHRTTVVIAEMHQRNAVHH